MTQPEFEKFINRLLVYFGKEKLFLSESSKRERLRVWYDKVSSIPGEPLEWIRTQMETDFDALPTNIPKEINHYWELWYEKHPEKRAYQNRAHESCPYCINGLIIFQGRSSKAYPYNTDKAARCGHCKSDTRQGIPMMTVFEGQNMGWIYQQPEKTTERR